MIELHNDELIFSFPEFRTQFEQRVQAWIDERVARATDEEKFLLPSSRSELYEKFDWCIPRVSAAVSFQRTLRIPDDGKDYPLPPGLGRFPVHQVDDFDGVPDQWKKTWWGHAADAPDRGFVAELFLDLSDGSQGRSWSNLRGFRRTLVRAAQSKAAKPRRSAGATLAGRIPGHR